MPPVPKVSYSVKYLYEWCPRQYKYIKVERRKPDYPPRLTTLVGRAVHEVVNIMYVKERFDLAFALELWPIHYYAQVQREGLIFKNKTQELRWLKIGQDIIRKFYSVAQSEGFLVKPIKTEWRAEYEVTSK